MEQQLNFCYKLGKTETHVGGSTVYGMEAMRRKCVYDLFNRFHDRKEMTEDELCWAQLSTSRIPDMIK